MFVNQYEKYVGGCLRMEIQWVCGAMISTVMENRCGISTGLV